MNKISNTVWGYICAGLILIGTAPQLINFIPDPYNKVIAGVCAIFAAVAVSQGFTNSKNQPPAPKKEDEPGK